MGSGKVAPYIVSKDKINVVQFKFPTREIPIYTRLAAKAVFYLCNYLGIIRYKLAPGNAWD